MGKMSYNPGIEYCEAARFIGKSLETEFDKLASLSSEILAAIADKEKLNSVLKTPFIQYLNTDRMTVGRISTIVGYLTDKHAPATSGLLSGELPPGRYVVDTVTGPHNQLPEANKQIQEWAATTGLEFKKKVIPGGFDWFSRYELYLVGPESFSDPNRWKTEIRYLLNDGQ